MRTISLIVLLFAVGLAAAAQGISGPATQPDVTEFSRAELEQRVAQLEGQVDRLERLLDPEAVPINLGRTNIAAVSSSGVNGGRPDTNGFYGVRNAFDGGENIISHINYTYWLSNGGPAWIDVAFDHPVVMRSAEVDGPAATLRLYNADGRQLAAIDLEPRATLPDPIAGVTKARIEFQGDGRNIQVREILLLGNPPVGVEVAAQTPRVVMNPAGARAAAQEAMRDWHQRLLLNVVPKASQSERGWVIEYRRDEQPIFRVVIDKHTSEVHTEAMVELAPRSPRGPDPHDH